MSVTIPPYEMGTGEGRTPGLDLLDVFCFSSGCFLSSSLLSVPKPILYSLTTYIETELLSGGEVCSLLFSCL